MNWWTVVRFLHLLGAVIWVGGQLTLALVVRQALERSVEDAERRREVFVAAGERFGRIGLIVIMPLLLGSGLALAYHRGVELSVLSMPGYGTTLAVKVVLAFVSFALAGVHGFVAARASRSMSRVLGIIGAGVSLAVVFLAASLVL
ncbi:MAG: hypothetical protein J5I28_10535 [Acidimicrobiales bacterium]|nr:hypothetical protein [Acidimicrobiales bacterium]HLV89650.1 hypothetical protein [Acidimicrobiia bacterium]